MRCGDLRASGVRRRRYCADRRVIDLPRLAGRRRRRARGPAGRRRAGAALARRRRPARVDAVVLPGGFSYGDYLRCGAIARFAPGDGDARRRRAGNGLPVLGICNGFQVLCESHLLPGALIRNATAASSAATSGCGSSTPTPRGRRGYEPGQEIVIPLKNGEGGFVADAAHAGRARGRGPGGGPLPRRQPERLATATSPASATRPGNVVGLMPHPEHAVERRSPARAPTASASSLASDARCHGMVAERVTTAARRMSTAPARHRRSVAAATPDAQQPLRRAGPEGRRVRPDPRDPRPPARPAAELAMYSVMWSEHCSYKSSKVHLRQFGETAPRDAPARCWSASARTPAWSTSATAGRSPSRSSRTTTRRYVEPYQGAATGVGGIVRDIMAMGARPIAVMDSLRFGAADAADTAAGAARRGRRRSAATATAWACPTSAARSSSTPATRATRW